MRTLACRAYWTALEGRPGAVHLNFPLREPLVERGASCRRRHEPAAPTAAVRAARRRRRAAADAPACSARARWSPAPGAACVVAGRHERATPLGEAAAAFARGAGWPLLADPLSGARRGEAAIAHYDALLRDDALRRGDRARPRAARRRPAGVEAAARRGSPGSASVRQVALDPEGAWQDPASVLSDSLALEPAAALARAGRRSRPAPRRRRGRARTGWRAGAAPTSARPRRSSACSPARSSASRRSPRELGRAAARGGDAVRRLLDAGARHRDVLAGARRPAAGALQPRRQRHRRHRLLGASARPPTASGPVVLLIGDVALAHDIGGLLAARRLALKLTIVLLDNDGGGIFDFLPGRRARAMRSSRATRHAHGATPTAGRAAATTSTRAHVATPTGLDFATAAALYGLAHERVDGRARASAPRWSARSRARALERSSRCAASARRNVALHRRALASARRARCALSPPAAAAAPAA